MLEKRVPSDLLVPNLIGGEPAMTTAQCRSAADYLLRMGCIEAEGDDLVVESVVRKLYIHG